MLRVSPVGKFLTQRRVEFADTDAAGIAHFASFFRYMEEAEHEMLRSVGLGVLHHREDELCVSWPRVSAKCDYRSPVRFEDVLSISVGVAKLGTKSATYAFEFDLGARRVAEGVVTAVCCVTDPAGHPQAISIPPGYRAGLTTFQF